MAKSIWHRWAVGLGIAGILGVSAVASLGAASSAIASPGAAQTTASRGAQTADAGRADGGSAAPAPTAGGNDLARGRARYDAVCGRCHPGGEEDVGPRVRGINWTVARMTTQIRSGSARMRAIPVSRLSDADMAAVMAYMRTIHGVQ